MFIICCTFATGKDNFRYCGNIIGFALNVCVCVHIYSLCVYTLLVLQSCFLFCVSLVTIITSFLYGLHFSWKESLALLQPKGWWLRRRVFLFSVTRILPGTVVMASCIGMLLLKIIVTRAWLENRFFEDAWRDTARQQNSWRKILGWFCILVLI